MTNPKTISPGLERAARAAHDNRVRRLNIGREQWVLWDDLPDAMKADLIGDMRASIATLLDPGSDVLSAAIAACRDTGQTGFDFKTVSKAVITAAIKNILGEDA